MVAFEEPVMSRSTRWVTLSKKLREERDGSCEGCGRRSETPLHCHHILERVDYPHLEYDREGILVICENCHRLQPRSYGAFPNQVKERILSFVSKHAPDRIDIKLCCQGLAQKLRHANVAERSIEAYKAYRLEVDAIKAANPFHPELKEREEMLEAWREKLPEDARE